MLKLTTDKYEASRGLSATAELLVLIVSDAICRTESELSPINKGKCWHESILVANVYVRVAYNCVAFKKQDVMLVACSDILVL